MNGRVLVIDGDPSNCEAIAMILRRDGLEVESCTSALDALGIVAARDFDVILTDLGMVPLGAALCERILGIRPDVPVVALAGASLDAAVGAIRAGAYDFITKPVDAEILSVVVARALKDATLRSEVTRLRRAVVDTQRFGRLLGESRPMKRVFELLGRVADSDASILITGESGTGKELIAHAVHEHSARRDGPFLAINCAAMPEALLESELFGHVRGAFTDAKAAHAGLFVQASGGTLFLDEIGDMPLEMQPKLLRALQERAVRPVGGDQEIAFDTRIVSATNRDIDADVEERRFRKDLYYRINVVRVDAPTLRERGSDVLLLAEHFLLELSHRSGKQVRAITPEAAEKLVAYNWPGNVRELENCLERAVALLRGGALTVDDLPEKIRQYRPDRLILAIEKVDQVVTLDELDRLYSERVIGLVGGNKTRAADLLGLDRRTLYRRLDRYRGA